MTIRKKVEAPIPPKALQDALRSGESKVVMRKGTENIPLSDFVSEENAQFSNVDLGAIIYHQDEVAVDKNGKEYRYPGGMVVALNWISPGFGFGELRIFRQNDGKIILKSEGLSKDFVKRMLNKLVDDASLEPSPFEKMAKKKAKKETIH